MSEVTEFLKNQTIFLTGVTGFLGKVLLWKALNEAGENIKFYVLVRPSKDGNIEQRIEEVFNTKIFDELLRSKPQLKECVIPIQGDITKEDLGLSEHDRKTLEKETTVIIHSAATTKFTENLKLAVQMNVLAVRAMLELGKNCSKLISFVQISTAYVAADTPNLPLIYEEIHPVRYTPFEVIQKVANLSLEEADAITAETIHPFPNTYSFTKSLGEHLLIKERGNLPICIIRPSIVTAAVCEPLPGWIDVLLGPAGLFIATGVGALRVMRGASKNVADFVPVDIVCNAILASAWRNVKLAKESPEEFPRNIPIYHVATSSANPLLWLWPRTMIPYYWQRYTPKKAFGYPFAFFCGNAHLFKILDFVFHMIPAVAADTYRVLQGKKAFMVKATKRMQRAVSGLAHFTTNNWIFSSQMTGKLHEDMNDNDKKVYNVDVKNY